MKSLKVKVQSLIFLTFTLLTLNLSVHAMEARLYWLPEGNLTYKAFSSNPARLPSYNNRETYKSFLLEIFWRSKENPEWGMDFRALQAGYTAAEERVGTNYQRSPMILSIQHWELLIEREVKRTENGFLAALGGLGHVTNRFERTKTVYINDININNALGLADEGAAASGLRTSIDNIAIPLGARWKYYLDQRTFIDTLMNYSFLVDFTDVLTGSSPFSGWASHARLTLGRRFKNGMEIFGGWLGYTDHMAAPAGQGGLRLRGGPNAPEGVYVLYQENEVSLSAALIGFSFPF